MTKDTDMTEQSEVTQGDIKAAALHWVGQKDRETFMDDIIYAERNWSSIGPVKSLAEAFARHRIAHTRSQPSELPDHAKRYLAYMCAYFHAYVNQGGVSLQSEAANDSISEIMELVPQEFHDLDFHLPSFGGEEGPWKCFHCNALFEDREAAFHHFGESEDEIAACLIEKGLATTTQPEAAQSSDAMRKCLEGLRDWFDTDAEVLAAMDADTLADHKRQVARIDAALGASNG